MEQLFAKGRSFSVFPIKVFSMTVEEELDFPVKVGVGASSKVFKKAVDRNRIKRLLREAYRLNKQPLYDCSTEQKKQVAVFMLYIEKTLPNITELQTKMPLAIDKLIKALS